MARTASAGQPSPAGNSVGGTNRTLLPGAVRRAIGAISACGRVSTARNVSRGGSHAASACAPGRTTLGGRVPKRKVGSHNLAAQRRRACGIARSSAQRPRLDGSLDDPIWQHAEAVSFAQRIARRRRLARHRQTRLRFAVSVFGRAMPKGRSRFVPSGRCARGRGKPICRRTIASI